MLWTEYRLKEFQYINPVNITPLNPVNEIDWKFTYNNQYIYSNDIQHIIITLKVKSEKYSS